MKNIDNNDKLLIFNIFSLIKNQQHQDALQIINNLNIDSQSTEIQGHLYSWKAQCLIQERQFDAAIRCFNFAIRIAKKQGQFDAVEELQQHRDQASAQAAVLLAPLSNDTQSPISNALALSESEPEQALQDLIDHQGTLDPTSQAKEYILCLLAQARLSPTPQISIDVALAHALLIDDPNLISAVKRTMDQLGLKAPTKTF